MRRVPRAAALSAAAFLFCGAGLASPASAQRADARPSAESRGLDDSADPATPGDVEDQLPIVTHAIARTAPHGLPGQQPDDNATGAPNGRSLADLVGDNQSADLLDEESDCL